MFKRVRTIGAISILVILLLALTVSVAAASGGNYHTVRYGETLFSIGRYYGVNPYHIAEVNGLPNPNCIYAGQKLLIPSYGYQDGRCYGGCYDDVQYDGGYDGGYGHGSNYHKVRRGETLTSIAYYYGVSPWAIARANHIYNLDRIYVGQVLHIPYGGGGHPVVYY